MIAITDAPSIIPQLIEFGLNPHEWSIYSFNEVQALFTNYEDPDFIFLGSFERDDQQNIRIQDMELLSF
jgi:hypothetical protein